MILFKLFAVLLMVTQTPVPVPRQAPDVGTYKSQTQNQGASTSQNPPTRLISFQTKKSHSPAFKPDTKENPTANNQPAINITNTAPVPVAWGWHEIAIFCANLALAIVGIAGIVVAIYTLCFIKRQAIEMRLQRITMVKTLSAIKEQAKSLKKQNDMIVSKERAQVSIQIESMGREKVPSITYKVISYGPTPAIIDRAWVFSIVLPSDELEWQDNVFSLPIEIPKIFKESAVTFESYIMIRDRLKEIDAGGMFLHFRAKIQYRDVFGNSHETTIARVYGRLPNPIYSDAAVWVDGPPEYNQST